MAKCIRIAFASVVLLAGYAADAAVLCQKGTRVKLRGDSCKAGWSQLAAFGGDPTGTWEFMDGTLFTSSYRRFAPTFLVLEPDGTGRLNLAGGDGGVLACGSFKYARTATPTLVMDLESIGYLGTRVVRYAQSGSDALALEGSDGRTAELVRVDAIPAASDCATLPEVALFTGLPVPNYWSGLAFDGTQLWYAVQNADEIVPVDPATGTAGRPEEFQSYPHAAAGADLWTHCACGGGEQATLFARDGRTLEDVDTRALGVELNVRALAWDPAASTLWLHGYTNDGEGKLLAVDPTGAEPDDLLRSLDLDADLSGLAFDGTSLWGVDQAARTLARIDPATGAATASFALPGAVAYWRAVAVVGDELVLLGDAGYEGVLLKVAIPPL